jgi:hypothetical protein
MTHQESWCHADVYPVASLKQIEVFAKVRPDLNCERLTVDQGPIEDDGFGTPTSASNANGLCFLIGEWVAPIDIWTQMVIYLRREKELGRNHSAYGRFRESDLWIRGREFRFSKVVR